MAAKKRRDLLKGLAMGSTTVIAGWTSGGRQDTTPEQDEDDGPNRMLFADVSDPDNLDPHAVDTTSDVSFLAFPGNAYETLLGFGPDDSEPQPLLATEVPSEDNGLVTNDGRTFEFPLREGVTFHTGGEMTAEDVRFSWERAMTMGLSPDVGTLNANIESMEAPDDYTFRVTLQETFAPFLTSVVTLPVTSVASREAIEENGGVQEGQPNEWMVENTAGTGPYVAGDWSRGNNIVWEVHEDYWGDPPGVGPVTQQAVPEVGTRAAMLERGDAHLVEAPAAVLSEVENTRNAKFEFSPLFDPAHITFNFDIPYELDNMPDEDTVPPDFFQDPNVRKAFAYAFDYDTYIEQIWNGRATRMNQYHMEGMLGFDESAPNYEHDPERALELFEEAGYGDGFTITSYDEQIPEFADGNLLLKDNIEALGDQFTLRVESIPESQMVERHSAEQFQFPMEFHGFLPQGPDPDAYYRALYSPDGSVGSRSSVEQAASDEIMELIDRAANEPNIDEREQLYAELQRRCFDDPAVIALTQEELMTMSRECVETANNPGWLRWQFKYFSVDQCDF